MTASPSLAGHVALVTGANRDGIGRAIARRLAAHGADLVLHASGPASREGLERSRTLIRQAGARAECIEADLADGDARADLIDRAAHFFGPVDILVNNAAKNVFAPPSKIDLPARHAIFEINFQAPVDLVQQALPAMRARGWGRIINITSESVKPPNLPYLGPAKFIHALSLYGASKLALDRYTRGLAAELHGTGITVNATKPYAVAWTGGADQLARQMLATNSAMVETLELLAEAALLLVTRGTTGLVLNSREILQLHQAPLHALDGQTVIGDATTLISEQSPLRPPS
ncbi:SDR family NAD(P)-dependent oxidoreductase [Flavisphingomonas formosensis]|uniref:SDR family NAD(P)-dependent oxidoreductase n=1 Tax=Flavisphingomonas formosensis TaxID=861534 RepID=UPI0012FBF333|nr:SDR family oxidoreductase [Sphingomonas formosensis]